LRSILILLFHFLLLPLSRRILFKIGTHMFLFHCPNSWTQLRNLRAHATQAASILTGIRASDYAIVLNIRFIPMENDCGMLENTAKTKLQNTVAWKYCYLSTEPGDTLLLL
jgi:hypothetical protein